MFKNIYRKFHLKTAVRNVFVLESAVQEIGNLDTIIFDIDGVIVDVYRSFRAAISKTIQFYFKAMHGLKGREKLVSISETQLFKNAGGFNNDWELTEAAILFYLYKFFSKETDDFLELKKAHPLLNEFTKAIGKSGGGLRSVDTWLREKTDNEAQFAKIMEAFDRKFVRQIFQELYAGEKAKDMYGLKERILKTKEGLYLKEKKILNENILEPQIFSFGILTGRTLEETDLVLESFPILKKLVSRNIKFDNGGKTKPHPGVLHAITQSSQSFIYIGDTVDDLRTIENYRNAFKKKKAFFGAVAHNRAMHHLFVKLKADIISDNVNDTLLLLYTLKGRIADEKSNC